MPRRGDHAPRHVLSRARVVLRLDAAAAGPIRLAIALAAAASACRGAPGPAQPVEPACPTGDAVVQVEAEAAALAGCAEVPGDLTVGPSFTLAGVTGLGDVRRVRGTLDVSDNLALAGLYLGSLTQVDGDLVIENDRALTTASLHRLTEVRGDLIVRGNRALERVDLTALRRVGGRLQLSGLPQLDSVELCALVRAAQIEIEDVPAWPPEEVETVKRRAASATAPRPR